MAVVHVVLSLDFGGLEHVVVDLVRQGRGLGQSPAVICLESRGTLAPRVESQGVRVFCVDKLPGLRPSCVKRVAQVLRELAPDVVHTHQLGALLYAGAAARRVGVPIVVHTEHGKHYAGRLRTRLLGRFAGRFAARFFCVSDDIANEVIAQRVVPADKVLVIPNGIDATRFRDRGSADGPQTRRDLGIPDDAPVVGTVGRLNEIKRQDLLIRAFARAREAAQCGGDHTARGAHLLLVGDGPLMGELRSLAESLGLEACIHFAGYQAHPERYLAAMDLFALTSRSEGMPLAVLEAWAAGLPVVASRVGGLPELISDGENGVLFPSGDEAALADALLGLLVAPQRARSLGDAGRAKVESRFTLARTAAEYDRSYRELSSRSKRGGP